MKDRLSHIVARCRQQDRKAQKELYEHYAPLFYAIALRYMKRPQEAEDVLVMSFTKIFEKLDTFSGQGSFEGWMKRILVNEALMQLRKKNNIHLSLEIEDRDVPSEANVLDQLMYDELLEMLDELPMGYRTVFNLYAVEGLKHREIAEELGISINTSKSQYLLARKRLVEILKKKDKNHHIA